MKYTQESLLNAIEEVKNGSPLKTAAKKYGIPRVTLLYKLKESFQLASEWYQKVYLAKNKKSC